MSTTDEATPYKDVKIKAGELGVREGLILLDNVTNQQEYMNLYREALPNLFSEDLTVEYERFDFEPGGILHSFPALRIGRKDEEEQPSKNIFIMFDGLFNAAPTHDKFIWNLTREMPNTQVYYLPWPGSQFHQPEVVGDEVFLGMTGEQMLNMMLDMKIQALRKLREQNPDAVLVSMDFSRGNVYQFVDVAYGDAMPEIYPENRYEKALEVCNAYSLSISPAIGPLPLIDNIKVNGLLRIIARDDEVLFSKFRDKRTIRELAGRERLDEGDLLVEATRATTCGPNLSALVFAQNRLAKRLASKGTILPQSARKRFIYGEQDVIASQDVVVGALGVDIVKEIEFMYHDEHARYPHHLAKQVMYTLESLANKGVSV
ncbi:hypothetical protein JW978_02310 [Candidatus Dojkabacteria bacterium]|nr:hypothetical protein [Candidatus Dojkabacteria bacterium]